MVSRVKNRGVVAFCVAAVVIIFVGYIAAFIYSRHVFAACLDRELQTLDRTTNIDWSRSTIEEGLFSSSLQVVGEFSQQSNVPLTRFTLPLVVHHGVFHTTLDGRIEPQWHSASQGASSQIADLFSGYTWPTFHVSINPLTRTIHGEVEATDFHHVLNGTPFTVGFSGLRLPFTLDGNHITYDLHWNALQWFDGQQHYRFGAGHDRVDRCLPSLSDRHQDVATSAAANFYHEQADIDNMRIDGLTPLPISSLNVTLQNIRYQADSSQRHGQLSYHVLASIEHAALSGKPLGSLYLDETLDHVNAPALRQLVNTMSGSFQQQGEPRSLQQLTQQAWPDIQALLQDSPRLHINQLVLTSPYLDKPLTLSGMINIDGRAGVPTSFDNARSTEGVEWWRQHLHGDLDMLQAPASLSALSGSEDGDDINLVISHGALKVNGQPLLTLF